MYVKAIGDIAISQLAPLFSLEVNSGRGLPSLNHRATTSTLNASMDWLPCIAQRGFSALCVMLCYRLLSCSFPKGDLSQS
jgi:hypothetical protein